MKKKVLVTPLDWGLGHATRCIPIIRALLENEFEVVIATSGSALPLLKLEFPKLTFFELPSYKAKYAGRVFFMTKIFLQTPVFLSVIRQEHKHLEALVESEKIDVVISDNRFGCYSKKVKSIFITHQLTILMPLYLRWMQRVINYFNHRMIARFSECWVPDFAEDRITEKLTMYGNLKVKYIGMLSRFQKSISAVERKYDLLVLLSGPEPQRSIFEEIVLKQLTLVDLKVLIVRGLPNDSNESSKPNASIAIINHLPSHELQQAIEASDVVLSRSGYTTVMDLYFLQKKAIFVPTPGQTEQEYLADKLHERGMFFSMRQESFNLEEALRQIKSYSGFHTIKTNMLESVIHNL